MSVQPEPRLSSFQRVTQDVLDLFELQLELLSVDSQEAKRKLTKAVICAVVAVTLACSALTVLMVSGGFLLAEFTELSIGVSLFIISGSFFVIVAILAGIAVSATKKAANAMSETKSEFTENLRWLKATLVSPKRSPRNQFRYDSFNDLDSAPPQTYGGSRSHATDHDSISQN